MPRLRMLNSNGRVENGTQACVKTNIRGNCKSGGGGRVRGEGKAALSHDPKYQISAKASSFFAFLLYIIVYAGGRLAGFV